MDRWMDGWAVAHGRVVWWVDVCMYVRTYVCMYVCIYVCMYVYMYVCMYVCMYVYIYMYGYMYVCIYACMDVCMYVWVDAWTVARLDGLIYKFNDGYTGGNFDPLDVLAETPVPSISFFPCFPSFHDLPSSPAALTSSGRRTPKSIIAEIRRSHVRYFLIFSGGSCCPRAGGG